MNFVRMKIQKRVIPIWKRSIVNMNRGSSGTGSTGLAEPINFERRVLQPVNFSGRKTKNSEV